MAQMSVRIRVLLQGIPFRARPMSITAATYMPTHGRDTRDEQAHELRLLEVMSTGFVAAGKSL
jgi:hypothetical protein